MITSTRTLLLLTLMVLLSINVVQGQSQMRGDRTLRSNSQPASPPTDQERIYKELEKKILLHESGEVPLEEQQYKMLKKRLAHHENRSSSGKPKSREEMAEHLAKQLEEHESGETVLEDGMYEQLKRKLEVYQSSIERRAAATSRDEHPRGVRLRDYVDVGFSGIYGLTFFLLFE